MTDAPKVFVHGNPETAAIWGPLIDALADRGQGSCIALSPPGFGAPVPPGWDPTPAAYVDWLRSELTEIGHPVDLVGHDWGAGHIFGLLANPHDMVRSWACDVAGLLHPDYQWHDQARVWQTPASGERAIAAMTAVDLEHRVAIYRDLGMSHGIASALAAAFNEDMGRCILGLYRGAPEPVLRKMADAIDAAPRRPGLILNATADAYVGAKFSPEVADRFDAHMVDLVDQGHWWMIANPEPAADALIDFWSRL